MGKIFIGNIRGPKGNKDDRGSNWKEGTAITGTSTTDTAFPDSGLTDAMVDDQYLNTDTGNLYTCTVAGDPNTAMWVYTGNIKGPKGDVEDGVIDFSESDDRENIVSGDTVSTVFGKIKKWFSDLGAAAFMNVVNGVTQSQAGQAVLDAAVGKYLEEKKLDITKIIANRNITEPGFVMNGKTVADALTELNGKLIFSQWTDFAPTIGTAWLEGMIQTLKQATNYSSFEYSHAASHEGVVYMFKRINDVVCGGIFIPGAGYGGRVYLIKGVPNDIDSWQYKEIV